MIISSSVIMQKMCYIWDKETEYWQILSQTTWFKY